MIRAFVGEKPLHTHENVGLDNFLERLESHWGGSAESITIVAHSMWNGSEIDAVCLLPRAIAVIDFKNHEGRIRVSENGAWLGDGGVVKGGSKLNPFVQVRDNKRAVIAWLEERKLLPDCNLGHISGAIVFMRPAIIEGDLGPKISSWFHVTDIDRCVELLASIASPKIQIDAKQIRSIVAALGVREYHSPRIRARIVDVDAAGEKVANHPSLTEKQREVLGTIVRFLENPSRKSLSVLGMTHTGKTVLLSETLRQLERSGRQPVVLAPNGRIARRLNQDFGLECRSIYSHVYDRGAAKSEKVGDTSGGRKRSIRVFPVRECIDPDDCVYLIDEAQLMGNDYFELEDGARYGSGMLTEDFLAFAALAASRRQLVLFGDPYQLPRGRHEAMPIFGDLQRTKGLDAASVTLSEMVEMPVRAIPLANARRLAQAIAAGQFTELRLESGEGFALLSRKDASDQARKSFRQQIAESWLVADTHVKVRKFNHWIRRQLFNQEAVQPISAGDLLEFYQAPEDDGDPFDTPPRSLAAGDRMIVQRVIESSIRNSQSLSGRESAVWFATSRIEFSFGGLRKSMLLLDDYLLAEKPELDPEIAIALEVWQKSSVGESVGRFRYGYASTAHHAQGLSQPVCLVDASSEGGRHAESYFRWLYTAITRASQHCIVFDFRELDAFDEAQWNERSAESVASLPIGGGWHFGSGNFVSDLTPATALPESGAPDSSQLEELSKVIGKLLQPLQWRITGLTSAPYQEQYQVRGPGGEDAKLFVSYNQRNVVTAMRIAGDASADSLLASILEAAVVAAPVDSRSRSIIQSARSRAATKMLRLAGAHRDGEYRLTLVLRSEADERAQIEVNHNNEGIVSTVRLVKFTGSQIRADVRHALVPVVEVN